MRNQAGLVEVENVSSHNYDGVALGIIDRQADGLVLDCGAGRRDYYFPNVVNYEVVDYDSTDVLGIGEELPFIDGAFDAVISIAVLEHVRDPFRCANELARVLKPGGELFCCVPLLQPVHGYPNHYFNATPSGLLRLFEDGNIDLEQASLTPIHPLWAVSWILGSWAKGLPEEARQAFEKLTAAELMVHPPALLDSPVATLLPKEKQLELACATILVARKREGQAPVGETSRIGTLVERFLGYILKSSPR
jgi:SAM-dependent methyltransferase